jgi:mannose-6-phosphate isomerase
MLAPLALEANQPTARPYRGGAGIARFRGTADPAASADPFMPEDFVASTTAVHGSADMGLTTLPDGRLLRDAIAADPLGFLGPQHVERFGADPALLVKLLHTGERLFVHAHPDDDFARAVLHEAHGKTEAWIVVEAENDEQSADAWLGFTRDVTPDELARWYATQDAAAMLATMHRVALRPGDTLFVPAALPHAIGPGLTLVELQQPVDLSLILEYASFPGLSADTALLGLSLDETLPALRATALSEDELARLRGSMSAADAPTGRLFPREADPFFAADRLRPGSGVQLSPTFSILVVTEGSGTLTWSGGSLELTHGATLLIPHGAGTTTLDGELTEIRARPARRSAG